MFIWKLPHSKYTTTNSHILSDSHSFTVFQNLSHLYASSSFKSHIILMGWGKGGKSPAAKLYTVWRKTDYDKT